MVVAAAVAHLSVVVPGERVTVRAEPGLERQAHRLAERAPRDLAAIEADLDGLPRVEHVEVRLVRHAEDIAGVAPDGHGAPEWAIGTAYPDEGVVVVAARGRNGDVLDMDRTFAHELAHMALDRSLGGENVPRWLTEGFAYRHSSDFSVSRAATLTSAVVANQILPLWRLENAFPAREDAAALAYAESFDFVAFLAHRGRWQDDRDDGDPSAFRDFLADLARGQSPDGAARQAFGRRLVDLENEWVDSLRGRYLWIPVGLGGALLWALGAVLLVIGWWRRRGQKRRTLARWAIEESEAQGRSLHDDGPS